MTKTNNILTNKKPFMVKDKIEIFNGDCINLLKNHGRENSVDLIITSPPYNCGIDYHSYNDNLPWNNYLKWCQQWLDECFRVCKDDGRIAINVPVEIGIENNKRRVSPMSEFIYMIEKSGFHLMGMPMWIDSHRAKLTAWGSWMSASAPYIYNPYETVILAYKSSYKKQKNGKSSITKEEFIKSCSGIWNIRPETKSVTKCNFPVELPKIIVNLLSYENDLIFDPFCGGGTTGIACLETNRMFTGIEIDTEYCKVATNRILNYSIQEKLF